MLYIHGIGMNKLSGVIHPYPTQAEGIKKAADAYKRTKLTDGKLMCNGHCIKGKYQILVVRASCSLVKYKLNA